MPRQPRKGSASGFYHFISRGVAKRQLFHTEEDRERYVNLLREYKLKFNISIIHYCLMMNHTHFILKSPDLQSLSQFGYYVQRRYAVYYQKKHKWKDQVFRNRFRSKPIEDEAYLLDCARYLDLNPVEAKIVADPKDYPHSSFHYYAYGRPDSLVTESPLYANLGRTNEERMLVYRFNVMHDRVNQSQTQPVPF